MKTLNEMWLNSVKLFATRPALCTRKSISKSKANGSIDEVIAYESLKYSDMEKEIVAFGAGLIALGLGECEAVGLVSENSYRWMICDLAIVGNRSFDVPRSVDSTDKEIKYIFNHACCRIILVQDKNQLKRIESLEDSLDKISSIIVMNGELNTTRDNIYSYNDVIGMGSDYQDEFHRRRKRTCCDDIATVMYTSGTTGKPKGVPLSHKNLMSNISGLSVTLPVKPAVRFLSILPVWHTFERTVEYYTLSQGASVWYTTRLTFLKDLSIVNPHYFVSVPRIWIAIHSRIIGNIKSRGMIKLFEKFYEHSTVVMKSRRQKMNRDYVLKDEPAKVKVSWKNYFYHQVGKILFYRKIKSKLGRCFYAGVSGGGSLPEYIDDFFEIIDVLIIEGYGLTETSPVICMRTPAHRIPYTAGLLMPDTHVKILDENGEQISNGGKGIIWVSGPQVMKGYHNDLEETQKVFCNDESGRRWFNTGDLGVRSKYGDISIIGRVKDTIVLIGGENIEPCPIEDLLASTPVVEQVMVCGQDQEYLTALIVPNMEMVKEECRRLGIKFDEGETLDSPEVKKLFVDIANDVIRSEIGSKETNVIKRVAFTTPFEVDDNTLTRTLKMKRQNILARDLERIKKMYPRYHNTGNIKGA